MTAETSWTNVNSSMIAACRWTPTGDSPMHGETGTLSIRFNSGGVYNYSAVPYDTYQQLLEAPSAGRYFNDTIKGVYDEG